MRNHKRDYAGAAVVLNALLTLENATKHLSTQYRDSLNRQEALAHFEARSIIVNARILVHNEACERFPWMHSLPLKQDEIQRAIAALKEPAPPSSRSTEVKEMES